MDEDLTKWFKTWAGQDEYWIRKYLQDRPHRIHRALGYMPEEQKKFEHQWSEASAKYYLSSLEEVTFDWFEKAVECVLKAQQELSGE